MDAALALIAAAPAVAALATPSPRVRAWALLAALALVAVLLPTRVLQGADARTVSDHAVVTGGVAVMALALAAGSARLFARHPQWLAVAAVAVVPFRVPIASGHGIAFVLAPLFVVLAGGALAYAVPRLGPEPEVARDRSPGPVDRVLAVLVALFALQSTYSVDPARALDVLVLALVPFALLFVLLSRLAWTPRLARSCLAVLAAVAVVLVGGAALEAVARVRLLDPDIVAATRFDAVARAGSAFFDPGLFGRYLAVVAVLVAAWMLWTRRTRDVALGGLTLAVLWGGLVLTLSRTSLAALLAGLAVVATLRFGARRTLLVGLAVVAVGAGLALAAPTRDALDLRPATDRVEHRVDALRDGVDLFAGRPVLGSGSGAFAAALRDRDGRSWPSATAAAGTTPVTVGAEQGVLGLAAYLALLATAGWALLRCPRAGPARAALAGAFTVTVAHSLARGALLEDPLTWTILAVATALAVAPATVSVRRQARAPAAEPEPVHA